MLRGVSPDQRSPPMATLAGVRTRRIGLLVNRRWTDASDSVTQNLISAATGERAAVEGANPLLLIASQVATGSP
jgi:hypothetical protein